MLFLKRLITTMVFVLTIGTMLGTQAQASRMGVQNPASPRRNMIQCTNQQAMWLLQFDWKERQLSKATQRPNRYRLGRRFVGRAVMQRMNVQPGQGEIENQALTNAPKPAN